MKKSFVVALVTLFTLFLCLPVSAASSVSQGRESNLTLEKVDAETGKPLNESTVKLIYQPRFMGRSFPVVQVITQKGGVRTIDYPNGEAYYHIMKTLRYVTANFGMIALSLLSLIMSCLAIYVFWTAFKFIKFSSNELGTDEDHMLDADGIGFP